MKRLRIATWNMDYWKSKTQVGDAWAYIDNELRPDIFLFQEGNPSGLDLKEQLLYQEIGGKRDWGSGIYCPEFELRSVEIETAFQGSIVIGDVILPERTKPLTCISMYGLMETIGSSGYSMPNLHRMLSDMTGLFDLKTEFGKRDIILAGDLNASRQFDETWPGKTHDTLFRRMAGFGLKDVYDLVGNDHYEQTLRFPRSKKPWQNDYIFLGGKLAKGYAGYKIIKDETVQALSDHNIVVAELDLTKSVG